MYLDVYFFIFILLGINSASYIPGFFLAFHQLLKTISHFLLKYFFARIFFPLLSFWESNLLIVGLPQSLPLNSSICLSLFLHSGELLQVHSSTLLLSSAVSSVWPSIAILILMVIYKFLFCCSIFSLNLSGHFFLILSYDLFTFSTPSFIL